MFKFLLKRNHRIEFFSRGVLGAIQITPYARVALSSTPPFLTFY